MDEDELTVLIHPKVRQQILKGQFVELEQLRQVQRTPDSKSDSVRNSKQKEIIAPSEWRRLFVTYAAIRGAAFHQEVAALWAHQGNVLLLANMYDWYLW